MIGLLILSIVAYQIFLKTLELGFGSLVGFLIYKIIKSSRDVSNKL